MGKVVSQEEIILVREQLRGEKKKVVFTNGCFDILHRGHVEYLSRAKTIGDVLVVGVNTDVSVRRIKGEKRPIVPEDDRATLLAALAVVDFVVLFTEETPLHLIEKIIPDILVKGADWDIENVVGKKIVEEHGGEVRTIEFIPNRSTTNIIERVLERYQ
jgi:rfaE bifunctional protein nucleotidyltransferase chain/domain